MREDPEPVALDGLQDEIGDGGRRRALVDRPPDVRYVTISWIASRCGASPNSAGQLRSESMIPVRTQPGQRQLTPTGRPADGHRVVEALGERDDGVLARVVRRREARDRGRRSTPC